MNEFHPLRHRRIRWHCDRACSLGFIRHIECSPLSAAENQINAELTRLRNAFSTVRLELETLKTSAAQVSGLAEFNAFLELHQMILDDPTLSHAALETVEQAQCNAEWAITQQMEVLVARFEEIEDAYLRERKTDVVQVVERVLKVLLGHPGYTPAIEA